MNLLSKLATPAALLFASALPAFASGIAATATYTATPDAVAGVYDYSLTLNNTGTTNIGEFWFAWIPGAGFLSVVPSAVGSPAGWTDTHTKVASDPGYQLIASPAAATPEPGTMLLTLTGFAAAAAARLCSRFRHLS